VVATLILLSGALTLNLVFEKRAELPLQEQFAASGMSDPGAFLVRNNFEAAEEILERMPVAALLLSFLGALADTWITQQSRRTALVGICIAPTLFLVGTIALWHANSIERSARPPFVMAGVLLASLALCTAHPLWSALTHNRE
jgi:hypothetical protein